MYGVDTFWPSLNRFQGIMRHNPISLLLILLTMPELAAAQEWAYYGGDPGGTKYSKLKQIDRNNVNQMRPAWMFHTGDISDGSKWPTRSVFETTPLVAN